MKSDVLPVESLRSAAVAAVSRHGAAVISAPPGSGKSILVPQFLLDGPDNGAILVLQPRRIAARSLAAYVARMRAEALGTVVGYQVRFESCLGPTTRIIYLTYGVFLRRLLESPRCPNIAAVILDEFHERTLEMDTTLAWLRQLRKSSAPAPAIIVMSATLNTEEIAAFLGAETPRLHADARVFPVGISHYPAARSETLEQAACAALKRLALQGLDGSILVFMPGIREIRRTINAMGPLCQHLNLRLFGLHGSLDLGEQMRIMDAAAHGDCVIVSTNVAETSLTIPGVTAVIDTGWERTAGYDPVRDRNTLYLSPISQLSAKQRAGRAGRNGPGRCIRLWDAAFERRMPQAQPPMITRLELSRTVMTVLGLLRFSKIAQSPPYLVSWLSAPEPSRWEQAMQRLHEIEMIDSCNHLTALGERLARWPTDPVAARILHDAQRQGAALLSCAAIALWESEDEDSGDLYEASLNFAVLCAHAGDRSEAKRAMAALIALCDRAAIERERAALHAAMTAAASEELRRRMALCWMRPLRRRIAVREETGSRYRFLDGKTAVIDGARAAAQKSLLPRALIGLTVRESGGAGLNRKNVILTYLPVEPSWIAQAFPGECNVERACRWDERREAAVGETRMVFGGLILERSTAAGAQVDSDAAASLLAARLMRDPSPIVDEAVSSLVARAQCVGRALPHYGFPLFGPGDWEVIYHEASRDKSALSELSPQTLYAAIRLYLGAARCDILDKCAPVRVRLPSGKWGRVRYAPDAPPTLSARIGDLIGARGPFCLCDGKVKGVYDILAPNMRTVQKTADIDGFWTSTYPKIKRELQRRYPRHPWP